MAKSIFDNVTLCKTWVKVAQEHGTRGDVVTQLLSVLGVEATEENRRKMYNNVSQRVRQLASHPTKPVVFPELSPGRKGVRRTDAQMDELQAILGVVKDATDDSAEQPVA